MSLPGVAELLRPSAAPGPDGGDNRRASGREKHTQKITVYLSAEELLDLERARLALLRYGIAADRGRVVREAIAVLLADLDAQGKDSLLARRIANGSTPVTGPGSDLGNADLGNAELGSAQLGSAQLGSTEPGSAALPGKDGLRTYAD